MVGCNPAVTNHCVLDHDDYGKSLRPRVESHHEYIKNGASRRVFHVPRAGLYSLDSRNFRLKAVGNLGAHGHEPVTRTLHVNGNDQDEYGLADSESERPRRPSNQTKPWGTLFENITYGTLADDNQNQSTNSQISNTNSSSELEHVYSQLRSPLLSETNSSFESENKYNKLRSSPKSRTNSSYGSKNENNKSRSLLISQTKATFESEQDIQSSDNTSRRISRPYDRPEKLWSRTSSSARRLRLSSSGRTSSRDESAKGQVISIDQVETLNRSNSYESTSFSRNRVSIEASRSQVGLKQECDQHSPVAAVRRNAVATEERRNHNVRKDSSLASRNSQDTGNPRVSGYRGVSQVPGYGRKRSNTPETKVRTTGKAM